jgi:hypothetical protein
VNTIFETGIVSLKNHGSKITVRSPNPWKMGEEIIKFITPNINETLILTPTKNGNRPLKALLNYLSANNIKINAGGINEKNDEKLRNGKLNVITFHSSKGVEAKNIILIVPFDAKDNPLYVALTRSFENMTIIIDPKKPNFEICKACRLRPELVDMDDATKKIVAACSITIKKEIVTRQLAPQRSLQRYRHRLSMYSSFTTRYENNGNSENIPKSFTISTSDDTYEDTSKVYAQAVILYLEYERTKRIRYMEDLLHPTRIDYEQQTKAIEFGMMNRFVYPNVPSSALLPNELLSKAEQAYSSSRDPKDFCTMALATLSWDDFHYIMRQLLPVETWMDEDYFNEICERALQLIPDDQSAVFDVRLKHAGESQILHLRAHIVTNAMVTHLVWANEISQADRADAALRAAMHPTKTCRVVNILTGETNLIKVEDNNLIDCIN